MAHTQSRGQPHGLSLQRPLAQSRHRISSLSGTKPFPTSEVVQREQLKQLWCQWRSSKEMYLPPPKPEGKKKKKEAAWDRGPPPSDSAGRPPRAALQSQRPGCPPARLTCDGLCAGAALFGIKAAKALDAVGLVLLRGELLPSQGGLAACADEALLVPRLVPVSHSALGQRL